MQYLREKISKLIAGLLILTAAFYVFSWYGLSERGATRWGVTFSTVMARQLGLDPLETYDALVDDLGVGLIRLPVYWSEIERTEGTYDFTEYDHFFRKAEENDVHLIPVVGRKLPRWPECHVPDWSHALSEEEFQKRVENEVRVILERYTSSPAVVRWQVENEPFHIYGSGCADRKVSAAAIDSEISIVRSLDSRPIMITDSGEQGIWASGLRRAEFLGISTYYQVWNDALKVVRFPFGPGFYFAKGKLLNLFYRDKTIVVSELQAEPWGPGLLPHFDLAFQLELMNEVRFREVIHRARLAGFEENILWGAEWWFWLKKTQQNELIWNEAQKLFR